MKNLCKTLMILIFVFSIYSCSGNDEAVQPTSTSTEGFDWRENSSTATEKTAGSSEVRTQYNSIFAFAGTAPISGTIFDINLTALTPGNYAFGSGNAFYFGGGSGNPTSGKVVISSNTNGKASGTFEAHYGSGNITALY